MRMSTPRRMTDAELTVPKSRRRGARASLACEGIELTDEEEALFERFDIEALPHEERRQRLIAYCRAKRREKALVSV
jgi:hypothetical protein